MSNITKRNIGAVVLVILPSFVAYYIGATRLTWENRDAVRSITNYGAVIVTFLASVYLVQFNIKLIKQKVQMNKVSLYIYSFLGIVGFLYSVYMLVILRAFSNINF